MGSPERRRKRKRTVRAYVGFRSHIRQGSVRRNLPSIAVVFSLAMMVAVCVRKSLRHSARIAAAELRVSARSASAPLAVLLQEQYEIDTQAATYADPAGHCLKSSSPSTGDLSERSGPFTCMADAPFFLRAMAATLGLPSVIVVDVGSPLPPGRKLIFPEAMQLKARVKAEDFASPGSARLILVEVHEEMLERNWTKLIDSFRQVITEGGTVVFRGEKAISLTEDESAVVSPGEGTWRKFANLMDALKTPTCDKNAGVAAAVGNFDGGIIVIRRATNDQSSSERGCTRDDGGKGKGDGFIALNPSQMLHFEKLFLWATGDPGTIESVQAKFGGVDEVRRYARRRSSRSACMDTFNSESLAESRVKLPSEGKESGDRLRGKQASVSAQDARIEHARLCLDRHLKEHAQDVRAAFAIELMLTGIGGSGAADARRRVTRLREQALAESGRSGALLWTDLHVNTARAIVTGA